MVRKPALALVACLALGLIVLGWEMLARTAFIEWTDLHQVIDGFGGSCADFYVPLPTEMADFFFTKAGIGLSLLRTQVVPSVADCEAFFGRAGKHCVNVSAGATMLQGELAIAKQAVARGVTLWSTPWSPPATMKTNGSFTHGGSLLPADYPGWAASLASYVVLMRSNGVPIYALSIQNEPDIAEKYGSAIYTARMIHDFVPYLYAALQTAGVGSTKIMIAEASHWDFSLVKSAMDDTSVAADVAILAAHGYGNGKVRAPKSYGKHVWETEDSSQAPTFDGSIADGLAWAVKIHQFLTVANVNAWHWWFLSNGPTYGDGLDNGALTDINLNYPKRTYVLGQWSRFVRPGWYRIGVRYSGPLLISAFKEPRTGSFALVAINPDGKPVSQTFSFHGLSPKSVTPWITSAKLSLAAQAPVSIKGTDFNYTLPPASVTTFSGLGSQE